MNVLGRMEPPKLEMKIPNTFMMETISFLSDSIIPIRFMYVFLPTFTMKNKRNVGRYTSPMDPMALWDLTGLSIVNEFL